MSIEQLQSIMIEHGVTIRAIPKIKVSRWSIPFYSEKYLKQIRGIVVYDSIRKIYMDEITEYPKNAGKFIIVPNCGTDSMINFNKPKYYNSIEDAINSLIG